jgi:hypothetical protein
VRVFNGAQCNGDLGDSFSRGGRRDDKLGSRRLRQQGPEREGEDGVPIRQCLDGETKYLASVLRGKERGHVGHWPRKWVTETVIGRHSASGRLHVGARHSGRSVGVHGQNRHLARSARGAGRKRPGGPGCWSAPRPFTDSMTCPINPRFFQIFEYLPNLKNIKHSLPVVPNFLNLACL